MSKIKLILTLMSLCLAPTVLAQTDCSTIVNAALEAVDTVCTETGRNQLCYGNILLAATPHNTSAQLQFEQPGDIVNVADVQNLRLSSFNLDDATWGVGLMNVQAYLPGTLPGQNVTFLLFGDVAIEDRGMRIVEVPVTATSDVNVRLRPTTETQVIASLRSAQEVIASGRLPDNSWIRVSLDDGLMGWVSSSFLDGDVSSLMEVDSDTNIFGPMQAFYFTTGISGAPCAEAPDSGILIQSQQGAGTVQLNANGVQIELGSTVYLQAVPDDVMTVSVIEGHATLTADGESQIVPAGTVSTVPLDAEGLASGAPAYPQPYAFQSLRLLPVDIAAFTPVTVGRAVATRNIPAAIVAAGGQASSTDTVCQVTASLSTTINFRDGPGTIYFVSGTMVSGNSYTVVGQALGTDGAVWWRVASDRWVRSNVVAMIGNCEDIPVVSSIPPTPIPGAGRTISNSTVCAGNTIRVATGSNVSISDTVPVSGLPDDAVISTFLVNGNVIHEGPGTAGSGGITWSFSWTATPGFHIIEVIHLPTISVQPAWSQVPFAPGESWVHELCRIIVE